MRQEMSNRKSPKSLFTALFCSACLSLLVVPVAAQEYNWAPDLPTGSPLPAFSLTDSESQTVAIGDLRGPEGMLLLFSRSTDW